MNDEAQNGFQIMTPSKNTGRKMEEMVAELYRQLGAKVTHDVEVAGNQIDVYVEMECPDKSIHRIAVEAKDWDRVVGIEVINNFNIVISNLRMANKIDEGVIVSEKGFSKQARNACDGHRIRALTFNDLSGIISNSFLQDKHQTKVFMGIFPIFPGAFNKPIPKVWSKALGSIGGAFIGLTIGLFFGMVIKSITLGLIAGGIIGLIAGFMQGAIIWRTLVSGINIGFVGAITGGIIGYVNSNSKFQSPIDGMIMGVIIGCLLGWLFLNRVAEAFEDNFSYATTQRIIRYILGPVLGSIHGGMISYSVTQAINAGTVTIGSQSSFVITTAFIGLMFGVFIISVYSSFVIYLGERFEKLFN